MQLGFSDSFLSLSLTERDERSDSNLPPLTPPPSARKINTPPRWAVPTSMETTIDKVHLQIAIHKETVFYLTIHRELMDQSKTLLGSIVSVILASNSLGCEQSFFVFQSITGQQWSVMQWPIDLDGRVGDGAKYKTDTPVAVKFGRQLRRLAEKSEQHCDSSSSRGRIKSQIHENRGTRDQDDDRESDERRLHQTRLKEFHCVNIPYVIQLAPMERHRKIKKQADDGENDRRPNQRLVRATNPTSPPTSRPPANSFQHQLLSLWAPSLSRARAPLH